MLPPSLVDLVAPIQVIQACASRLGVTSHALYLAFARELAGVHPILDCHTVAQLETLLADWQGDAIDATAMALLVESLPTLNADAVDPSRWNSAGIHRKGSRNQTGPASIATISA